MSARKAPHRRPAAANKLPRLPALLSRKIYKTGQTRGADDDEIFQNRVLRTGTVVIPYNCWDLCALPPDGSSKYENGFIVLISPSDYFGTENIDTVLAAKGLKLGSNALVFYETREQWNVHNPEQRNWTAAQRRRKPLGGQYVARVPATTATKDGKKINRGFATTKPKGAGIRVYEYANEEIVSKCRQQLEALFWCCRDAEKVVTANGMQADAADTRKRAILEICKERDLMDRAQLTQARVMNADGVATCPLCLEELSAQAFFNRLEQAEGRFVHDLTVTQVNLFHIAELRYGVLNHRPYNLGWGHHHCNVVVKDSGILKTLEWMRDVLDRNIKEGHLPTEKTPVVAGAVVAS
jgi:hypothetical protein